MNTHFPFVFSQQLILRTPSVPYSEKDTKETPTALLDKDDFMEAIYLASPVLFKEAIKLKQGLVTDAKEQQKIELSLVKYYERMYSRCTPFGLFSGCSIIDWSDRENGITILQNNKERHTRLDMHYLCALSQHLAKIPAIKNQLIYFPNNSYYKTADEIRYVEYKYVNGRRIHQISALMDSVYLSELLLAAEAGSTIAQMKDLLMKEEVSEEEALEFIEELLEAQILTNELEPSITGAEFIYQMLQSLERINRPANIEITTIIATLKEMDQLLAGLDKKRTNTAAEYKQIMTAIDSLGVPYEEHKLFQTDLVQVTGKAKLPIRYQLPVTEALSFLNGLQTNRKNPQLESFCRRFQERFEDKEMPLLQVLDAETGIGYLENTGKNISPLLDDLFLPVAGNAQEQISWDKSTQWLFNLLKKATANHSYAIELENEEIQEQQLLWNDLPPSISVMFRIVENGTLLMESCGGSSAANLMARFAHGDQKISNLIQSITKEEQERNENVVFAEIVHLPESRVGNILLHPEFRNYEIPYLAQSSLPKEQQVPVSDLYIRVQQNQIRLRSKKLNKLIIPRLSSAHNFSNNALPVYQFLCDLQVQNLRSGFSFFWGSFSVAYQFLPRVTYKGVILSEACWQYPKKDIESFIKAIREKDLPFLKAQQIPSLLVLAEGDNELLLDIANPASVNAFEDAVKSRNNIVLKEFLRPDSKLVTNETGAPYVNQFIASLVKNTTTYADKGEQPEIQQEIQRSFVPGNEWLYVKLYCGVKSADKILEESLNPWIQSLQDQKLIDNWFFIRYRDNDFHIRLRLHIPLRENIGTVTETGGLILQHLQDNGLVWKIQFDSYHRELERYGGRLCESAEQLFWIDSSLTMQFLLQTEGDKRESIRWLWGMKNIDFLLDAFAYTLDQKIQLLDQIRTGFNKEFNFNKFSLQSINKKYNAQKKELDLLFGRINETELTEKIPMHMFADWEKVLKATAGFILQQSKLRGITIDALLSSYMHMSLNRLFLSESRLQEAIIYEFLYKWYVSLKHRNK